MSPKNSEIELGEALFIQKIKANNLITLEKDAREVLDVGIGDRVICYKGPWENSVVLMPVKSMQKPIQNNLSKSSSVNYTTTRSGDPTPIIEIANNRVYPNSEGVYPQNCKIYKDESKK